MVLSNITEIKESITARIYNAITQFIYFLFEKIKPLLYVILIAILIFIIYKLIKLVIKIIREKRIRITFSNTQLILERLEILEEKINLLLKMKDMEKQKKIKKSV